MTRLYLLDTNTASYIIKGTIPAVRHRLTRVPMAQVLVSAVTEGELRYGVARLSGATKLERLVEEFLIRVNVLPWNSDAAKQYGLLRADLERSGKPISDLDMMIAAHALAAGAILVSNDAAFAHVKNLKLEDWTI